MDEPADSLLRLTLVERTAGEIAFLNGESSRPGVEGLSARGVQEHLDEMEDLGWVEGAAQGRWRITESGRQHLLTFGRWQVDIESVVPPQGRGRVVGQGPAHGGVPHRGDRFKVTRGGDDAELPVGAVIAFRHAEVAGGRALAELEVAWVDLVPGDVLVRWDPLIEGSSADAAVESTRSGESSVAAITFPETYEDERGVDDIVWQARPLTGVAHPTPGFEIQTIVRGVEVEGLDFDGLEPIDPSAATSAGLSASPDLTDCVLTGDVPCVIEHDGQRERLTVSFRLDLTANARRSPNPRNLQLRTSRGSSSVQVDDDWFEDGLQRLAALLPDGDRLICCVTCLFSDYSPYGHGLTGMVCHRGAKEAYLSVRSKHEYWSIPVTEYVMETHLCDEYQRRVPDTATEADGCFPRPVHVALGEPWSPWDTRAPAGRLVTPEDDGRRRSSRWSSEESAPG